MVYQKQHSGDSSNNCRHFGANDNACALYTLQPMEGGILNILWQVKENERADDSSMLLVRAFGPLGKGLVDHEFEFACLKALNLRHVCMPVYAK